MVEMKIKEGFKRTQLGEVPNDWDEVLFNDLFEEVVEYTNDIKKYPLYSLTIENGVTPKTERYERSFLITKDNDNYKVVKKDEFVYNPMNLRFGAIARLKEDKQVSVSGYYNIFRVKADYSPKFIEYFLKSERMMYLYNAFATGSLKEKQRVHFSQFVKFNLPIPSKYEADKIASILSTWDKAIELKEKKIERKTELKKGLLQKLITGEVRLPGFDCVWKKVRLEEISKCLDSMRKPLNSTERDTMKGDIPYYGANGIVDYINKYIFNEKLILLAEDGGPFNEFRDKPIAMKIEGKAWVNNHAHILKIDGADYDFVFYSLVHKDIRKYINGSTRGKLTKSDMLSIELELPKTVEEQQSISKVLNGVTKEIELMNEEVNQLKLQKKGLMQLLLTGKVRVQV